MARPKTEWEKALRRADDLDKRRQQQIENQRQSLNKVTTELRNLQHEHTGTMIVMAVLLGRLGASKDPVNVSREELLTELRKVVVDQKPEGDLAITLENPS